MSLPNPGQDAVPFTPLTAEFYDDTIENIEALAAGTGLDDDSVIPAKLSNPYKAKAHAAANQTISDATATVITFGTEDYDPNNNFSSNAYTVPVTGWYQVNCGVTISAGGKGASYRINARKGGVDIAQAQNVPFPASTIYGDVSLFYGDVLFLTAGDVIDFRALCDTSDSSSPLILGAATNQLTYCSFHLLSV